jgi:hypothetical protein
VAFSERENFRYFFSRYNMMSFSGLCSKSWNIHRSYYVNWTRRN